MDNPVAHSYILFADYHQIYVQDDDSSKGDLSAAWSQDAWERMLAVVPHALGIGTARDTFVPVKLFIHEQKPEINLEFWDFVNHASFQVDTGRIVVAGCTDYFPGASRIEVVPGTYEAVICYGNLSSVTNLEGKDYYEMHLFPGQIIEPITIKAFKRSQ